jgi:acyl-coenzyme A thioesterase 13
MLSYFEKVIGKEAKETSPSPFGRWINGTLVSAEIGKLVAEVIVRPEMANPGNIMHGGAIAGIFDEVIGMCTFTLDTEGFFVAINLNVDFLRPGNVGETLRFEAEIIRQGKTMLHAEAKAYNAQGKLIAKASSNLALTKR